ncbi:MAG: alanine--glyoxylate aminotransferase family protein [Nitrospinaceae bacterium]|jgi:alanine-glyoxylate transaminase / serine-glyoxylate transaminase / serine-pyruvate transaminase|nr:alanine--glyoxylate aminotransferase family protein [Nitrospinaceae bacterium]MBT3435780.1 alanine--glyoxylate aminotransferase family protein [Nitrospinaceae bacterium]MBT5369825.1 alanine--glyoxylate aminotransferase family protein [Nitrospinaceae bacterium]MBT5947194.1 alanine--glyoxylate aminotransferase family protein [Nitrospinaceae bacterium]MBT6395632.1 alanine--glyoxylate aminotransferase family protein [Nitrospinaceae bacterium]
MSIGELNPHLRLLLGPGPSPVHPRVLKAMSTNVVGHLDPDFLAVMDDCQVMLREVFGTKNRVTFPVSGTGSAGMEAAVCNVIEPGDKAIICVNGVFGTRMTDVAGRYGAEVIKVEAPWGEPIDPAEVKKALDANPDAALVGIVHAETSTGVLQPMEEIGAACQGHGALLLMDCVTSLGGVPVEVDKWGVEIAYSGTQKCLSCPPGVAPLTMSERALGKMRERKNKVASWYFDVSMIESYWGSDRSYHHTGPITMNYAIREALRLVLEEGLEARFDRHALASKALQAGVEALGLSMFAQEGARTPTLNTVSIGDNIDDGAVRKSLLNDFNIEIGGGLGPVAGKAWRIGMMGHGARQENVAYLISALEVIFKRMGYTQKVGDASAAVTQVYAEALS